MPRARANIRAKFIAQIEIGVTLVNRSRRPAALSRPTMVSRSGRPAATSEPKASNKMAKVTGHESISERSMAVRLAVLKSDHSTDAPVAATVMSCSLSWRTGCWRASAARTMSLGSAPAPPSMTAALPLRLMDTPGSGGTTRLILGSAASRCSALRITACTEGSVTGRSAATTTSMAELA